MTNIERVEAMVRSLEEGTILLQDTCDEIHFDLAGNFEEINPHTEHWLVQEINSKSYVLYNLDNQRSWRVPKEEMALYLYGNERFGLKAMLRISEEVA